MKIVQSSTNCHYRAFF